MKITLQTLTKDLCAYNLWANHQLVFQLTENEQIVSFEVSEINQKLSHLLAAEEEWLEKMQCVRGRTAEERIFEGAIDALLKDLLIQSENLLNYVSDLSEETLKEEVAFDIPGTGDFKMSRYEMVQHIVGEGTYQRGKIMRVRVFNKA